MTVTVIYENKYSFSDFDEYTRRAQIKLELPDGEFYQTDVYTTQINKDYFKTDLKERFGNKIVDFKITHWTTRKSDDAQSKFMQSWFND